MRARRKRKGRAQPKLNGLNGKPSWERAKILLWVDEFIAASACSSGLEKKSPLVGVNWRYLPLEMTWCGLALGLTIGGGVAGFGWTSLDWVGLAGRVEFRGADWWPSGRDIRRQ
jgi:hypothetical protein